MKDEDMAADNVNALRAIRNDWMRCCYHTSCPTGNWETAECIRVTILHAPDKSGQALRANLVVENGLPRSG